MSGIHINKNIQFLAGGGEMGALTREKDWSKTPVGNPETWPQSLRTALSILLNSKFPMFLFWGPELICFYNDAYRPSLGNSGKHPAILGGRGEDYWQEIWEDIKPLIDQVLAGGEATWSEDQLLPIYRNGKMEDVYWTFSYSPVNDESGLPAGVFVTCNETTDKINNFKSLEESNRRYYNHIMQAPVAMCVFKGKEHVVEIANELMLGLWGVTKEQVINRPIFEGLPEAKDQGLELLLDMVYKTGEKFVANERPVNLPRNGQIETTYINFVYEALKEPNGTISGIVAIATEVTPQVLARKKVEKDEKRFRDTVQQAPLGITILMGPEFIVEMANETYLQLVDRKESDFVGKPLYDSLPEVKDFVGPLLTGVFNTGVAFNATEFPIVLNRYGKKELTYFSFIYHPRKEEDGTISGVIVVAMEVTGQVKAKHALTESEKQFRNLVMQSPIPMAIFRGENYVIEMGNKVMFEKMWRKKESDVLGKKLLDVFPELKEQKYPELLHDVYTTGKNHTEVESVAYVQGDDELRKFYLDFDYTALLDADRSISGLMVTVSDVTEKVEARIKVEESERRFRDVADSAPVLIWMSETDMLCNFFNTAWLNFTGRSMKQEIGNGWMEGMHPEDFQRCQEVYADAFEHQKEFYTEYRLKRHDGEYRWISDKGVPRLNSEGVFEGFIGACMDIHEQVVYQKKLKEDEVRLNIVIEASELGTWELNLKTREVYYSDRYLEIFGYSSRVELTHAQLVMHLHPDDLPIREEAFAQAFVTGVLSYESRLIWNDQSIHWMEGKGKVFYDEENQPIRLIGTIRDITEEKNYQRQLQEREQKFRLLADSMPQFVWTGDAEGNLNYFNQAVYHYSGLTPEQMLVEGWLQIVHPDDQEENIQSWTESIATGQDFLFEHRFRRHDGVYRWQLSRAIPQRDANGTIQMWVGTSTDIEDQKTFTQELEKQVQERTTLLLESNEKLEESIKELQKMNAELKSFAYISSHDLQEPLRKIQTFVSRILEKEHQNLSETGKNYFQRMQDAARRMQTLIEDLLAYSRTNTTERAFQLTNLEELVAEVKSEFREALAENHGVIEVGAMCEANIIPFQFRQLLQNLIGNALKFSKPDVPPHVVITSEIVPGDPAQVPGLLPQKRYVQLSVSDNGIGFEPHYKDRIFEVFQRLHGKDKYKGTGIGLAIVKKIVENHNGIIVATGELDQGARFDIYIPV